MANILAFSGSTRSDSFNKKILKAAVMGAKNGGAEVTVIELSDYDLPIYDGDLEHREGIPKNALKLKELFLSNHGLLLALPEYNSSMSGVFKNVIDWVSRPTEDEDAPLSCFKNKTAALMSASPGHLGGARGLVHAKSMLENIHVHVLPKHVCVAMADKAFDDEDILKDETTRLSIEKLGFYLAHLLDEEVDMHPLDPDATAPAHH
jgi:chromate reductase